MKRKEAGLNLVVVNTHFPDWGLCEIVNVGETAIIQELLKDKMVRHYSSYGQLKAITTKADQAIPIVDCPICGRETPLSFKATLTKGEKSIDIYECAYCGKVPNVATDIKIKKYIEIK